MTASKAINVKSYDMVSSNTIKIVAKGAPTTQAATDAMPATGGAATGTIPRRTGALATTPGAAPAVAAAAAAASAPASAASPYDDYRSLADPALVSQQRRINDLPDRMEQENVDFYKKVREGYLLLARSLPERFYVVDGTRELKVNQEDILKTVLEHI